MTSPLVTRDEVLQADRRLARLLRHLIYGLGIDRDTYDVQHKAYTARQRRNAYRKVINSTRYNDRRMLSEGPITEKTFDRCVEDILGLKVVDMTVTLEDPKTKQRYTLSTRDVPAAKPGQLRPQPRPLRLVSNTGV